MHAVLVDDEPLSRKILREELEAFPDISVDAEASDGDEAIGLVRQHRPELLFLDLQMPGLNGFDVIARLDPGPFPVVIVVTAYDQYAMRAFDAGAIDYLLKPVSGERLATAVEKVSRIAKKPGEAAEYAARLSEITGLHQNARPLKIVGKVGEEYFLLNPDEVFAFQAEGDVVWIITSKRRYQATATLKALQQKLEGLNFRRIHRNSLVNVEHVRKMASLSSHRWLLTLSNNLEFIVSKRLAGAVRSILHC